MCSSHSESEGPIEISVKTNVTDMEMLSYIIVIIITIILNGERNGS